MKKNIFIIASCCLFAAVNLSFGQTIINAPQIDTPRHTEEQVYTIVQQQPEFVGGQKAMAQFLRDNFHYPKKAQRMNITGKVFVRFIIKKDGTVDDASILKGISNCQECNEEALRLVRMMPAWEPGMQNGNPVSVYFNLPINFMLIEDKPIDKK